MLLKGNRSVRTATHVVKITATIAAIRWLTLIQTKLDSGIKLPPHSGHFGHTEPASFQTANDPDMRVIKTISVATIASFGTDFSKVGSLFFSVFV